MPTEINIPAPMLHALRVCAATTDERDELNGVRVDISGQNAFFVATDGKILMVHRVTLDCAHGKAVYLIPHSGLMALPKEGMVQMSVTNGVLSFSTGDRQYGIKRISSTLPWRRVLALGQSGEPAMYDGALITQLVNAYRIAHGLGSADRAPIYVQQNGQCAAYADMRLDNTVTVIMPLRALPKPLSYPDWLDN